MQHHDRTLKALKNTIATFDKCHKNAHFMLHDIS